METHHRTTRPGPRDPERVNWTATGPNFVEWLMGLERGWVTDPLLGLTDPQQLTALGNGVLPRQAVVAVEIVR